MKKLLAIFVCMAALLGACTKNEGKSADSTESNTDTPPVVQENRNTDPNTPSAVRENWNASSDDNDNTDSPQEVQTSLNKPMFVTATSGLLVRDEPGLDGNRLGSLDFGTVVTIVKEEGEAVNLDGVEGKWVYLESPVAGWVFDGYLGEVIAEGELGSVPREAITIFDEKPEYPIYVEADLEGRGVRPYLIFSDNTKEGIYYGHDMGSLRNTIVYAMPNKESESKMIGGLDNARVFIIPENEDWLYLLGFGFIYVYDLPGSEDQLENELFRKFPIFKRHGPLLEVNYNGKIVKIWNRGNEVSTYILELCDYYEDYGELLIYWRRYESSGYNIYSLQQEEFTDYQGYFPYFNNARNTVATLIADNYRTLVRVYAINNGVYTKVLEEIPVGDYIYSEKIYWINDNEFRLKASDGSTLVIRRNGTGFELAYE